MTTVQEVLPDALRQDAAAALEWFNRHEGVEFEITGIVDPEEAVAASGVRTLRLVLCGGERCEQRSFRVTSGAGGYEVEFAEPEPAPPGPLAPELDPPPGARRGWLDRILGEHSFVVLIFYRGFW